MTLRKRLFFLSMYCSNLVISSLKLYLSFLLTLYGAGSLSINSEPNRSKYCFRASSVSTLMSLFSYMMKRSLEIKTYLNIAFLPSVR